MKQLFRELKRRNVYKVAVTYVVAAFVVLQLADLAAGAFGFPGWFEPMIWVVAGLGFPIALVLAWAFELTAAGVQRTPDAETSEESSEPAEDRRSRSRLALQALVGLGLVAAAVAGGWYLTGGGGESPEVSEFTVAVLPFQVSGAGADTWRDGMVTLMTPGLDGAGSLRAISDRTVFAAWEERTGGDQGTSGEEALSIAREIGAEYAVVGSAVTLGSDLRLTANVHSTRSGDNLGQVEARGSPDSVMVLADSLTRRVLGLLLEESEAEIPSVDLASLTTSSLPALKSFLRGERQFRAGEYSLANQEYDAAVEQDSSFALAYARLDVSRAWAGEGSGQSPLRRAYELSDRLPQRERRLVRAQYLWIVRNQAVAAADTLRRLSEEYPDDPSMWYWLGETIFHAYIPGGWSEAETAFQEAVRLDPDIAPYHHHLVDMAMSLHHDSALAARRIEAHPSGRRKNWYQAVWDLNFGSGDRRQDGWTRIDTLSLGAAWWVFWPLRHPMDLELRDTVLHRLMKREDVNTSGDFNLLILTRLMRGQTGQALTDLRTRDGDAGAIGCNLAVALTLGHPIPDSTAARHLSPESFPDEPSLTRFFCAGLYLVESGRSDELDDLIRRLRATVDTAGPGGVSAGRRQAIVRELRGYRAWKAGNLERAAQLWNRSHVFGGRSPFATRGALWRGDLYRQLGRLHEAEGWYLAAWEYHPLAHERLGQLYEEMGRPEEAAAAYRRFIAAWKDVDEGLQPRVEAARERLAALEGGGDEER